MTGKVVHGHTRRNSKTYRAWSAMWDRCYRSKNSRYDRYGGRGITVCDRWKNFENFLADMGIAPVNTLLDRKDNNGNYEPFNCRWATIVESNRNTSRYGK